jgi:DNA-binding MarR family transcriptional regulator
VKTSNNQPSELIYEQGSMPEIFFLINKITKNLDKFQRMVLRETHLTPPQYAVLNALDSSGKDTHALSLSHLAQICYSSRPTMTHLIDTLETKNIVKRVPNPKDRRSLLVTLTPKGKRMKKEAPSVNNIFAECCSIFDPNESDTLSLLLNKLNSTLKGYLKYDENKKD